MMIYDYARKQAGIRPEAVAIRMGPDSITYAELESQSNRLAGLLIEKGLQPEDRVCIFAQKHPNTIMAMSGINKAGGIYVPLDVNSPAERVARMVHSAHPAFILTDSLSKDAFISLRRETDDIPVIWWSVEDEPENIPLPFFSITDLSKAGDVPHSVDAYPARAAHILFTSGSTGEPKGVMIKHENVTSFIDWAVRHFDMKPGERNSGHSPLHFDLSTFDIYGTFAAGGELYPVPYDMSINPGKLVSFMLENELNQWFSVPSALNYLARFRAIPKGGFPNLKRLIWCGEVFPLSGLKYWMNTLPDLVFSNLYGPTEATIASSYYTLNAIPSEDIPIGRACGGESLLVLDESLNEVAPGNIGDLYISGAGLSPGYWISPNPNVPNITRPSTFLSRDAKDGTKERIYKTGDLASVDQTGLVYFHGRADYQIKSRGYRIELGEIETALGYSELLREFAVIPVKKGGFEGTAIGCAFVRSDQKGTNGRVETDLKKTLQKRVPGYMIPQFWKEYEKLPRNGNGKIDRKTLSDHLEQS